MPEIDYDALFATFPKAGASQQPTDYDALFATFPKAGASQQPIDYDALFATFPKANTAVPAPQQAPSSAPESVPFDGGYSAGFTPTDKPVTGSVAPVLQSAGRQFKLGAQAVGRGVADTLGMPVNLVAGALNMLPGVPPVKNPVGGSAWIEDAASSAAKALGYTPEKPTGDGEKIVGEAVRMATGSLLPGGMLARSANTGQQSGSALVRGLQQPYVGNAGSALVGDVAAGAGSGASIAGLETLGGPKEGSPYRPLADLIAGIFGGVGGITLAKGAAMPATGAANLVRDLSQPSIPFDAAGNTPSRSIVNRAAAATQESAASLPDAIATLTGNMVDAKQQGYRTASTGYLSGDVGLAGLENRMRRTTPQNFTANDQAVRADAADRFLSVAADGNPDAARSAVQAQRGADVAAAEGGVQRAQDNLNRLTPLQDNLTAEGQKAVAAVYPIEGPTAAQHAASRDFTTAVVDKALVPETVLKNDLFDSPNAAGVTVHLGRLSEKIQSIRDAVSPLLKAGGKLPVDAMTRIEKMAEGPVYAEWGDLSKLRRDLSSMRDKAIQSGSFDLADNVRALQSAIDDEGRRIIDRGGAAGEALSAAWKNYDERYAPVFGRGAGRDLRDDFHRGKLTPSETLSTYYLTGRPAKETIDDLGRIVQISKTPQEANDAVRRYVVADMARTMNPETGAVNIPMLRKWRSDRAAIFDDPRFANLATEVDGFIRDANNRSQRRTELSKDVAEFSDALRAAEGNVASTKARYNDGVLGLMTGYEPAKAARSILDGNDPVNQMREAVRTVARDPAAAEGWKRAVAEAVREKVQTTVLTPDGRREVGLGKLISTLDAHTPALKEVYTPGERNVLESVKRQLAPYQTGEVPANSMVKPTPLIDGIIRIVEPTVRMEFDNMKGGGYVANARAMVRRWLPDSTPQVYALIMRGMTDPEVGRLLLERNIETIKSPSFQARLNAAVNASVAQGDADRKGQAR